VLAKPVTVPLTTLGSAGVTGSVGAATAPGTAMTGGADAAVPPPGTSPPPHATTSAAMAMATIE
jgi:hypothetical protein